MRRARVLFVAEAVTLAHVARAFVLARSLDSDRYDVHVAWDPRYNALLGALPFTFHSIESLSTPTFLARLARGAPMHDTETLRGYVREDLSAIDRVRPDVIVSDFRLSLAASARLRGIPLVTVANAYWSPYGRQTFLFPEYDYPLGRILGRHASRALFSAFRSIGFAAHTRPLNIVLREHGLPGIGDDIRVMYTWGDYTAYADIPELVPTWDLPSTHRYLGAVLWSPSVDAPQWWKDLPSDRPIVYATPGSSGDRDVLPVVLDALADLEVTVVAATAGRGLAGRIPGNARVADFVNGTAAACRAALVICNGGSPTTYQALAAGVPVLALATNNMDQHLNMDAVCRAGAGAVLRARAVSAPAIREGVERLLVNDAYRRAAGAVAHAHRALVATKQFADWMNEITSSPGVAAKM